MNQGTQQVLDELKFYLEGCYGDRLANLVLFGSHARDEAEAGSDIDVMVSLHGSVLPCDEISRTADKVAEISLEHNVVISCVFVSHERFQREQSPLLLNVRREGVSI